jgi:hypothetical protein
MNKVWASIQGIWFCLSFIAKEIWNEYLVDLHPNKIPLHPNDYLWFAERWNGRVAMITIIAVLQLELIYKVSIWELIGVL